MYRKTGEVALAAGVYHSVCRCRTELTIRKGERFPECSKCKHQVDWVFTRSVYQQVVPKPAAGDGGHPGGSNPGGSTPGGRPPPTA